MRHLHTKRWYFCPACCTVCNNLTLLSLFSLSQSVWHRFPIFPPSIVTLLCCFLHCPHGGASHHFFPFCFVLFVLTSHHRSFFYSLSVLPPFSCIICFSLSVMAYQDGFYGAADLYVSTPASPPLPPSSPTFPLPLVALWVFKCEMARIKPVETCTFECFDILLKLKRGLWLKSKFAQSHIQRASVRLAVQHNTAKPCTHSWVDSSRVCLCAFVS